MTYFKTERDFSRLRPSAQTTKRYNSNMLTEYIVRDPAMIADVIEQHGIVVVDDFLPIATISTLAVEIQQLHSEQKMQPAGTGRGQKLLNQSLRGDHILWLDAQNATAAQQTYFASMESLRQHLNQTLYLGLFALESHLALYTAGTRYATHLDRFKNSNNDLPLRQVTCILYLNQDWQDNNGGHLRIYTQKKQPPTADSAYVDVLPIASRLVLFLSDTFYHEVLPATRDRMSLTGWFLTR